MIMSNKYFRFAFYVASSAMFAVVTATESTSEVTTMTMPNRLGLRGGPTTSSRSLFDCHSIDSNGLLDNGCECAEDDDCVSGRCDRQNKSNPFAQRYCEAKLPVGEACSEHTDCSSGTCSFAVFRKCIDNEWEGNEEGDTSSATATWPPSDSPTTIDDIELENSTIAEVEADPILIGALVGILMILFFCCGYLIIFKPNHKIFRICGWCDGCCDGGCDFSE